MAPSGVTLTSSAPAHVLLSALGGGLSEGFTVVVPTVDGRVGGLLPAPPAGAIQVSLLDGPRGLLASRSPGLAEGKGRTPTRPQSSASSHPTATRGTL